MGRVGKIRRLPASLREQINAMLDSGRTLDEIAAHLKTLGADVSRSGLGRYKQRIEKVASRLRASREAAEALVARLGEGTDEGRIGRMLTQTIMNLTHDYILKRLDDPEAEMEIEELRKLARVVREATLAGRAGQTHEIKTAEVVRAEAAEGEAGAATAGWEE
ncbi:MAG: DUF3486 family protein [Desulfovibrio sp.]|jgi:uncharacterized protein YheU (UPF0270 family)|nr:DUF3486 family protein [Desulfovibrio sp.]